MPTNRKTPPGLKDAFYGNVALDKDGKPVPLHCGLVYFQPSQVRFVTAQTIVRSGNGFENARAKKRLVGPYDAASDAENSVRTYLLDQGIASGVQGAATPKSAGKPAPFLADEDIDVDDTASRQPMTLTTGEGEAVVDDKELSPHGALVMIDAAAKDIAKTAEQLDKAPGGATFHLPTEVPDLPVDNVQTQEEKNAEHEKRMAEAERAQHDPPPPPLEEAQPPAPPAPAEEALQELAEAESTVTPEPVPPSDTPPARSPQDVLAAARKHKKKS